MGRKYPILNTYQNEVDVQEYALQLGRLIDDLEKKYGYDDMNAFLVLKDILAAVWKDRKDS